VGWATDVVHPDLFFVFGGEMADVSEALYKYLHPSRIGVLRDLLIRFTQASSLNDTLELRTPTKGVAERERLEGIVRERLAPSLWSQSSEKSRKTLDLVSPGLPDLVGEIYLQTFTNKAVVQIERRYEENARKVFDVTNKNFGILSLTEVPNDIRMWGHYADGGRGFLIEFDPNHAWFHGKREERDSFRHIRQVQYVSSRPAKFLLDVTELDFLYTKWDAWRDEHEWRIIRCFNDAKMISDKRDPYGNDVILFAIPPDAIKSVILGFSAEPELEEGVRGILANNPNLNHLQVKRASQSVETGQVTILPM
jgi:Protein of unknown function (DUF2971)